MISNWCRTGATGSDAPASSATWRTQPPAASTTTGAAIDRRSVSTPATRPALTEIPMTGSCSATTIPSRWQAVVQARMKLTGSSM